MVRAGGDGGDIAEPGDRHHGIAIVGAAVTELPDEVVAPRQQGAVAGESQAVVVAGGEGVDGGHVARQSRPQPREGPQGAHLTVRSRTPAPDAVLFGCRRVKRRSDNPAVAGCWTGGSQFADHGLAGPDGE